MGIHADDKELEKILDRIAKKFIKSVKEKPFKDHKTIINVKSRNEFHRIINEERAVVAVFTSPYCGACRAYEPIFERVAEELKDKAVFVKVNVLENIDLAQEYDIMATPTTLIFYKGEPVKMILGAVSADLLRESIINAIK